eukprot:1746077-Pleurochrysis_carterae.AAC.1
MILSYGYARSWTTGNALSRKSAMLPGELRRTERSALVLGSLHLQDWAAHGRRVSIRVSCWHTMPAVLQLEPGVDDVKMETRLHSRYYPYIESR